MFGFKKALNSSYDKGKLSLSLRQCLIVCLPKKDKSREEIKNWRPLSMLSSIYKLASAAIANRIKPLLNYLIDSTQTGFISGRDIAENTCLVYDIIHTTKKIKHIRTPSFNRFSEGILFHLMGIYFQNSLISRFWSQLSEMD